MKTTANIVKSAVMADVFQKILTFSYRFPHTTESTEGYTRLKETIKKKKKP